MIWVLQKPLGESFKEYYNTTITIYGITGIDGAGDPKKDAGVIIDCYHVFEEKLFSAGATQQIVTTESFYCGPDADIKGAVGTNGTNLIVMTSDGRQLRPKKVLKYWDDQQQLTVVVILI